MTDSQGRGPMLTNLYGKTVELQGGGTVVADEAYIRESIVNPQAKIVAGFQPIMPTFQGLVIGGAVAAAHCVHPIAEPADARGDRRPGRPTAPAAVPQALRTIWKP